MRGCDVVSRFQKTYANFINNDDTTEAAYRAMIRAYCESNGRVLDEKHRELAAAAGNLLLDGTVLGELSPKILQRYGQELREDGYTQFAERLTSELLKRLTKFSMGLNLSIPNSTSPVRNDSEEPVAEFYRASKLDLKNNPIFSA